MSIQTSESIDQVGAAFSQAQVEIEAAKRNSKNPAFKRGGKESTYASLSDVQAALKPHLNKHGLYLLHPLVQASRENHTACQVWLGHGASGQYISAVFELAIDKQTPQGFGSAGTYTQRYALCSFFALEQEDDDGNIASGNATAPPQQRVVTTQPIVPQVDPERPINDVERGKLNAMRLELGMTPVTADMKYKEIQPMVLELQKEKRKREAKDNGNTNG